MEMRHKESRNAFIHLLMCVNQKSCIPYCAAQEINRGVKNLLVGEAVKMLQCD